MTEALRIGVDVGGTFTDVAIGIPSDGRIVIGKSLTTPQSLEVGLLSALEVAAREMELDLHDLLASAEMFIYATTQATNAIIERRTAKTAFLVTEGFPDVLVRREGGKENPYDLDDAYPAPYVPRALTFEIPERITAEGDVTLPLDEAHVLDTVDELRRLGVEAIGVCFLWSIANSIHERRVGELLARELPHVDVTLSYQINPIHREFRRASTTVLDASLKPMMKHHLSEINRTLGERGYQGAILGATSLGGVIQLDELAARPIHAVKSGPSLGPVAGRAVAKAENTASDLIVCDTGGTSFDVSLIRNGSITLTNETWLGERFTGAFTGFGSCDVRSVGAGGGSIAWTDEGGLLQVGPRSAGAHPGPACYGQGGQEPTVTDAATVLGYLNPASFLGGRMTLDLQAAREAVGALAERLGDTIEGTATGILAVANEHMVEAIRTITISDGADPREAVIVAGGGAAGLSIIPIARELGCKTVLVPRAAGVFSASGALYSDVVTERMASLLTDSERFDFDSVSRTLQELEIAIQEFQAEHERGRAASFTREYSVDARYRHQVWELELRLRRPRCESDTDVAGMVRDFHELHNEVFAVQEPGQVVEFLHWRVRLTGALSAPWMRPSTLALEASRPSKRWATFRDASGALEVAHVPIYPAVAVERGTEIEGPAIIEEPSTTLVVYPGSSLRLTAEDNYFITVGE